MTALLESFVAGRCVRASDTDVLLLDANTGRSVARISASGPDFAEMTRHGREVGGPALSRLTFHEGAGLLKSLAKHLMGVKDPFFALSGRTGATQRDSVVDIDGGIGTLLSYASKGTRELPNDIMCLHRGTESLSRGGAFVGQHIYISRPGVAVQINALTSRSGDCLRSSPLHSLPGSQQS